MHEPVYPAVGEDVMVEVRSLCTNQVPLGAYVALLEYNNIEGFVSPLFRRSIILRQRPRWARPGTRHVCRVLRVDELRGYIDLSPPWSLSREEIVGCEDRFLRYSLVHAFVRAVSRSTGVEMRVPSGGVAAFLIVTCCRVFDTLFRCDRAPARLDTPSPSSDALLAALLETARVAKEGRTLTSAQIRSWRPTT